MLRKERAVSSLFFGQYVLELKAETDCGTIEHSSANPEFKTF
jgi:hypothetical protein